MLPIHYSLLIHFIGIGMLFTTIFAGWLLNGQYKRAPDSNSKAQVLKSLRAIGLLSPFGILLMLLSGVGNMTLGPRQFTLFSDSWLSVKLVFFLVFVIVGILFSIRSARRTKLALQSAASPASPETEQTIRTMNRHQRMFYIVQTVLMLVILMLSIVQPHG